jgi:putative membrane protein
VPKPPLDEVGTAPDYRFTFANERTFLAWVRTSLALVAAGVAVIELLPGSQRSLESYLVGMPLIGLGTALPILSLRRWDENERAMRLGHPLPRTRLLTLLAWWVTVTAALGTLVLFLTND